MVAVFWCWLGLMAVIVATWAGRHYQLSRARRDLPPLTADMYAGPMDDLPSVSVLVAAKDEETNIDDCVRSLLSQQYPHFEVIAINDRSSDRTAEIIDRWAGADPRFVALHVRELRPGWFGKNNAMREGIQRARHDWFCFTDADCVFTSPRALAVAMRYALAERADFLSILPAHQSRSFWERVIQPACSGIMMLWFHPLRVNDPGRATAYANGAFMLMRRSCYEAIGGHEAVKTDVNEDLQMAIRAKRAGLRLRVTSNEDLYTVRMYSTLRQIWAGWTRIFYGCFRTPRRLVASILAVAVFSLLPWATALAGLLILGGDAPGRGLWAWLTGAAAVAGLMQISVMCRFYALTRSSPLYGILYPLGAAISLGTLINALWRAGGRGAITWRGTTYQGAEVIHAAAAPPGGAPQKT